MIRVEDDGDVRVVTLDRPDVRNALTPDGLEALGEAVAGAATPVVYLRGAGEAFCAGADLSVVAEVAESGETEEFAARGQRVARAIETADAAGVAGVDGPARGGGVELALACDLRAATPRASFAEPGATFGLFGAWGGTVRLPELVGLGDALDLSLSGRTVDAEEARRIGLVQRVVDDPRTVAGELAGNDPGALRLVKQRVRDRAPRERQEAAERAAFRELVAEHGDDLAEYRNS